MNITARKLAALAGAMGAVAWAAPVVSLAEESAVGADILIPKLAEFIPALIAFLIILVVLAKLVWPSVLEMMEKRQAKIQSDLDEAERSKREAAEEAKSYEGKILEAHHEADAIIAKAKKEAEEVRSQVLAKAQREAADIIAKAHGAVDSERHKAMIELSSSVVDLSVEIASKIIGNDLSEDEQRRLAEKYLAEAYTRALLEAARSEGRANADLVQWQHARKFTPEVLETLAAMQREDDIGLLEEVAKRYKELLDSQDTTVSVTVTTAVPLDDDLRAKVRAKAESDLKAPVYLVERVDPAIIGGIMLEVRGKRYDASVRAQLANIRKTLSSTFIEGEER